MRLASSSDASSLHHENGLAGIFGPALSRRLGLETSPVGHGRGWYVSQLNPTPYNAVSGLENSSRGWGGNPDDWYGVRRPIPKSQWIEVIDLAADERIEH